MKTLNQKYQAKALQPDQAIEGVSARALAAHHDDLYVGYVKKANEIQSRLEDLAQEVGSGKASGNSTYSELRGLKNDETYAVNGIYLHEWYFGGLGSDGDAKERRALPLVAALEEEFHTLDKFISSFTECAMASRGWTILAWDTKAHRLAIYNADTHNQGGVWGAIPVIVLDVYEHAYFMDFAADRKAYIESFWKSLDWNAVDATFSKIRTIRL